MTKTIRLVTRCTITPVTLAALWLFVRLLSVFIMTLHRIGSGGQGFDHNAFEVDLARDILWYPLGIAGLAGLVWWAAGKLHWQFIRTVCHECFSVYLAVFLGVVLTFVHARYAWQWYLPAGLMVALIVLIDPDDERYWSRALRFSAIPIITLLTIHSAASP